MRLVRRTRDEVGVSEVWQMARQMMAAQRAPELVLVLDGIDAVFDWREAVKCEWDTDGHNGGCKVFCVRAIIALP